MTHDDKRGLSPVGVLFVLLLIAGVVIALLEQASQALLAKQGTGNLPSSYHPVAGLLHSYLADRRQLHLPVSDNYFCRSRCPS